MFNAIIIGSTGATGKYLLKHLLYNPNCNRVTSIGRRMASEEEESDKLVDVVIDSLFDLSSTYSFWKDNDVFFNCIGTTRQRAGGANSFIDVEVGISKLAAKMASEAKISHASIISAKGANHNSWSVNWIHPLLYIKTMGEKEQTIVSDYSFKNATIFRPAFLNREVNRSNRGNLFSLTNKFGLSVNTLALAMMEDAENLISDPINKRVQYYIGNDQIINASAN